jgi:uncharacterized protein YceH (UPF0502 family)
MYSFDDIAAVQATLERLAGRAAAADSGTQPVESSGPLVVMLPRQPGSREARFAHLLGGPVAAAALESPRPGASASSHAASRTAALLTTEEFAQREAQLDSRILALQAAITALETRLAALEDRAPNPAGILGPPMPPR